MIKKVLISTAAILACANLAFTSEAEAQQYGGSVTMGMYGDLYTPDLHRTLGNPTAQFGGLVAESLVTYSKTCDIVPSLAKSWDVGPGAKSYTFHLRKGVKFHNGKELTAEIVKANMDHFKAKETKSPRRKTYKSVKKIEVIDKYTLKLSLKKGDYGFLVKIRPTLFFITHPDSFEAKPPHPIGTGPFKFVEWKPKQYAKVTKFGNYWKKAPNGDKLPYIDNVTLRPIPDATVRYTALRAGDVDWVWALPPEVVPNLLKKAPKGLQTSIRSGARWFYVNMNNIAGPTKDIKVRRALAYALNKQELMDAITWGLSKAGVQPYYPGSTWNHPGVKQPYPQDLAKSRALLKEAGYPDGVTVNAIVPNQSILLNLATVVQAQLKKVGIKVNIKSMDKSAHHKRRIKQKFDISIGHLAYAPDPASTYDRFFYSKAKFNFGKYINKDFDKLLDKARGITDHKARKAEYRKVLAVLHRDVPIAFLGYLPIAQASRSRLQGMKTNCRGDIIANDKGGISKAWIQK